MGGWYVRGIPARYSPASGGPGWPALLAVLAAALGFIALVLAVHRFWVRRRRRSPGAWINPSDMPDVWVDFIARYHEVTASERVYAGWRRPWWRRRHRGPSIVVPAGETERGRR